nr:uncharacterized protein LOC129277817 [Lytechinus pictus]
MSLQHTRYGCLFGRNKNAARLKREEQKREACLKGDHPTTKRRYKKVQGSRKKGCLAFIHVKEVIQFTDFKDCTSEYRQKKTSLAIRKALENGEALKTERKVYIRLPKEEDHDTHKVGQLTGFLIPLDKVLAKHLHFLVGQGVTSVREMRRHLKVHVETVLFPNADSRPPTSNMAYYPSDGCIRNHIYAARTKLRYSKLDQENLEMKVKEWAHQHPEDRFKLTLASSVPTGGHPESVQQEVEDDEEEVIPIPTESSGSNFFFCHQTKFQRHLLQRYGNDICLLDATYRTTKYALPLFFLAVKTNSGYSVVAEFVVQFETVAAIQMGLNTIQQWMIEDGMQWNPAYFMTDFSEREIKAIELTFPTCSVFLCDFHREQSWVRWTKKTDNGVADCKKTVLFMMRNCAHATKPAEYEMALSAFRASREWQMNTKLQKWFSKQWLPHFKRWVWAFRSEKGLLVNTNNGLERQNRTFKYSFLEQKKDHSISSMVSVLVTEFLPSMKRKYIQENACAMQTTGRTYSDTIPSYLRDRPDYFIQHCMKKIENAGTIGKDDVVRISNHHFQVKSESSVPGCYYNVHTTSEQKIPSCECWSWMWSRLPCKHMFALFNLREARWQDLPEEYRELPLFTVDTLVSGFVLEGSSVNEEIPEFLSVEGEGGYADPLPLPHQPSSRRGIGIQVREHLDALKVMSFSCTNLEILTAMEDKLGLLVATTHLRMQNDAGLIERPPLQQPSNKRKQQNARENGNLPQRKKRKSVRFGAAADRKEESSRLITDYISGQVFTKTTDPTITPTPAASTVNPQRAVSVDVTDAATSSDTVPGVTTTANQTTRPSAYTTLKTTRATAREAAAATRSCKGNTGLHISELEGLDKETFPLVSDGSRYTVCRETLEYRDFHSLQYPHWINDKILNAYMSLLAEENNKMNQEHIFPIPSYAGVHWQRDLYQTWLFRKVNMQKFRWIFMPINVNQNHWVLLVADVREGEVSVLDSMPGPTTSIFWINKFRAFMDHRVKEIGDLAGKQWKAGTLQSLRQQDGHSCGAFVMLNALALSRGMDPLEVKPYTKQIRIHVCQELLKKAVVPVNQRKVCDMLTCLNTSEKLTKVERSWVQCDVCGRWLHLHCVSLAKPPQAKDDYICPICTALYK